jgi:hypothetical protein
MLADIDIFDQLHRADLMIDQQKCLVLRSKCRGHDVVSLERSPQSRKMRTRTSRSYYAFL